MSTFPDFSRITVFQFKYLILILILILATFKLFERDTMTSTSTFQETKEIVKVLPSSLTPTCMNLSSPFSISSPLIFCKDVPCNYNKHPDCWLVPMEHLSDHVSEDRIDHGPDDRFGITILFVPQQFYPCRVDINQRINQWTTRLNSETTKHI